MHPRYGMLIWVSQLLNVAKMEEVSDTGIHRRSEWGAWLGGDCPSSTLDCQVSWSVKWGSGQADSVACDTCDTLVPTVACTCICWNESSKWKRWLINWLKLSSLWSSICIKIERLKRMCVCMRELIPHAPKPFPTREPFSHGISVGIRCSVTGYWVVLGST